MGAAVGRHSAGKVAARVRVTAIHAGTTVFAGVVQRRARRACGVAPLVATVASAVSKSATSGNGVVVAVSVRGARAHTFWIANVASVACTAVLRRVVVHRALVAVGAGPVVGAH